ncbi:dihydroorotase [Aquicella lusitana]|uniref:Dihydroorotase n=1 Tax=Aquicella lusitana TaxID=254246 RepID=A0A370GBW6_9COXI|nr:dihydroorotase [Aquicella lusitana]RDI41305.1 dihydroorotase [Aquicella lusitana]VVC72328.1 Allantoinase [Aquicella lusitana]
MTIIKDIKTYQGNTIDLVLADNKDHIIQADGLTALPAVIDPHVHFRTPGMEYKEDWRTGAKAAIRGGCTTVFDMPNTKPPTITQSLLDEKKALIDRQLKEAGIPLRYKLFFGADKGHLDEIANIEKDCVGIKVFMGCSTGNLVIDDDESLHAVFSLAAKHHMLVAVHAEDEHLIRERKANYQGEWNYPVHSVIRNIDVAAKAVEKAIALTKRYGTRLYILHVSSAEEVALIKTAKQAGLPVFAETTPHHLFFDTTLYDVLAGKAVVNPPLRDPRHREHLFAAIHEKVIDTIGSDHAPHTPDEKALPYGECPSGMPGIEFMLPMLLNACSRDLLNLDEVVALTSANARHIFHMPPSDDWVLVNLGETRTVERTESKCGWSPYMGLTLKGWPVYTILKDTCYKVNN